MERSMIMDNIITFTINGQIVTIEETEEVLDLLKRGKLLIYYFNASM